MRALSASRLTPLALGLAFIGLTVAGTCATPPDREASSASAGAPGEAAPAAPATEAVAPPAWSPLGPEGCVLPGDDASPLPADYVLAAPTFKTTDAVPGEGALWVRFDTNYGAMAAELFEREAPLAVANFVGLAQGCWPFADPETGAPTRRRAFDGSVFHRVIPGFMIQGGDPAGTGRGGPGYFFDNERNTRSYDSPGYLGMANRGPNTNGSQFFITLSPQAHLNQGYTIFGKLAWGLNVVDTIARVPRDGGNRPLRAARIEQVEIKRAPQLPWAAPTPSEPQ